METESESSADDRELPTDLADNLRLALGLDVRPETLGDWADATAGHLADSGVSLGVEELCLTDSSRHEARVGDETYRFACVLDAMLLPFVLDGTPEVAVVSRSPVSDAVVEFEVTQEGVSADPGDAVLSFGVARDVSAPDERAGVPTDGYEQFCPYINAFPDEAEYRAWSERTPDAETVALSPPAGFDLARRLAEELAA